jgi:hypothetical protein
MKKAILLLSAVCLFSTSIASADTLIYNNSTLSGYNFSPGANYEIYDYGTSPGGLVSKFSFEYIETNTTAGTIRVRFYEGTNPYLYDPGDKMKEYALTFVPGTNNHVSRYEYVIPQDDWFVLSSGNFGYSFEFSQITTKLVLASGGAGQVNELWEYDDWLYGDWTPFWFGGTPWAGLSMKIYTIPEPASLLLLALGGVMLRRKK